MSGGGRSRRGGGKGGSADVNLQLPDANNAAECDEQLAAQEGGQVQGNEAQADVEDGEGPRVRPPSGAAGSAAAAADPSGDAAAAVGAAGVASAAGGKGAASASPLRRRTNEGELIPLGTADVSGIFEYVEQLFEAVRETVSNAGGLEDMSPTQVREVFLTTVAQLVEPEEHEIVLAAIRLAGYDLYPEPGASGLGAHPLAKTSGGAWYTPRPNEALQDFLNRNFTGVELLQLQRWDSKCRLLRHSVNVHPCENWRHDNNVLFAKRVLHQKKLAVDSECKQFLYSVCKFRSCNANTCWFFHVLGACPSLIENSGFTCSRIHAFEYLGVMFTTSRTVNPLIHDDEKRAEELSKRIDHIVTVRRKELQTMQCAAQGVTAHTYKIAAASVHRARDSLELRQHFSGEHQQVPQQPRREGGRGSPQHRRGSSQPPPQSRRRR